MEIFKKPVLCIELRDNTVKFIEGFRDNAAIHVEKYGTVILEDRHLQELLPYPHEETIKVLKNMLVKNKINARVGRVTFWHGSILVRIVKVPMMSEMDLDHYMKVEIKRLLPPGVEDFVYDYKVLEKIEEDTPSIRVMISAFPRNLRERLEELFIKMNLHVEVLDVYPNNLSRVYGGFSNENIAIADVSGSYLDFLILTKGKTFMYSHNDLEGLDYFRETIEEVEKPDFTRGHQFLELIKPIDSYLGSYFSYFSSRNQGEKIDKLILVGGIADVPNIDMYLKNRFQLEVHKGLPEYITIDSANQFYRYVGPLGLLMRDG